MEQSSPDQFTIIDVRNPEEYEEKHIPAAVNIPLKELENYSIQISKNVIIITVCGKGGGRSAEGAKYLNQLGFSNAKFLCGGTFSWFENS